MSFFGLVLLVVAMIGVVAMILLYERKRAQQIQRDLREGAAWTRRGRGLDD